MNYKTSKEADEELLLLSGGNWIENTVIPTSSHRPGNIPVTTTLVKSPSKERLFYSEKGENLPETRVSESPSRNEKLSSIGSSGEEKNDRSLRARTEEYHERSSASLASEWVSFEESSNHVNLQHPRPDYATSTREVPEADNSVILGLKNDGNWVKFDIARDDNSVVSSSFTQQAENIADERQTTGQSTGKKELDLVKTLPPDDAHSNPFDNSELDRINSFSRASAKRGNSHSPIISAIHQSSRPAPVDVQSSESEMLQKLPRVHKDSTGDGPPSTTSSENLSTFQEYPPKSTNTVWPVLLRYPDTKRRLRGREWRPVVLKLSGSVLQVFEEPDTSTPFREVSLQCFYSLSTPKLQNYHGSKIHAVKILYVKYKETQKRFSKKNVQYVARATPILKIASYSHDVIREFVEVVNDALRSLPIFRDRGISHNTEAVYINVHDTCSVLLDSTGAIRMLGLLVRIYLRAFISGDAECQLVLNDINLKSQEEARLREELMPQRVHKWIKLEKCDFHSTVDPDSFHEKHYIMLHPLDSCTFEVMQFRVHHVKQLPLLVCCDIIVDGHGRVELKAEVKLCGDAKMAKYERRNICLYFPIPESWVPLFMREKLFGGETSIKSTSVQKAIKMRNKLNQAACTIEVSTGSAKYEPEYKAVVWRINRLPLLNTTAPADSSHDFLCHVQTPDSFGLPDDYEPHCLMEYDIPYTVASDTNIVNFTVSDKKIDAREVSYHTYYSYHVQMNATSLNDGL